MVYILYDVHFETEVGINFCNNQDIYHSTYHIILKRRNILKFINLIFHYKKIVGSLAHQAVTRSIVMCKV